MISFSTGMAFRDYCRRVLALLLFGCALIFAAPVRAQQPDDVVTTNTALVQLSVGVVDQQGRAITTLGSNDFVIYEDGVKRPILLFEPADTPFSLVLLLDMSGSTINFRQQIRAAALRFLDALSPQDRVAVVQFNGKGVKSLLGFSTDRNRTAYAITDLANGAGETFLYDALKFSIKELAREGKRRKAIVVLTDGKDTGVQKEDRAVVSKFDAADPKISSAIQAEANSQLNAVLNEADRQGVTIFPLGLPSGDPKRLPMPDPFITAMYSAARTRLQLLADRTGGRLHEIRRLDDLSRLYAQVAADLRTLYTIAYQQPNPNTRDGKWRAIRIELARADLVASTKPGYYAR
ncbi:MAG: VWA domain-containing protein [Acidobacteriota bacterium]